VDKISVILLLTVFPSQPAITWIINHWHTWPRVFQVCEIFSSL